MNNQTIAAVAAFTAFAEAVEARDLPASIAARKALARHGFRVAYQIAPAVIRQGEDAHIGHVIAALPAKRGGGR